MEVFHVLRFLKIVKESIKLVPKNGKMMASIMMLSLLLPSLLLVLVLYFHKFLTQKLDRAIEESQWSDLGYNPNPNPNPIFLIIYFFALLMVAVAAFLFLTAVNSSISVTAVILVSAMSYTGEEATMQDLLERMIKNYARHLSSPGSARRSRNPTLILVLIVAASFAYRTFHPDAITNTIVVVVGITIFIFMRYTSVVGNMGAVVWVVEERARGDNGIMEKAEELVEGHRMQGFMVNMLVSVFPIWHVLLGYWMVWIRDRSYLKGAIYGVLFFNSVCLARIFVAVAYTVLYFECKSQKIDRAQAMV